MERDSESDRLTGRLARYASVGAGVGTAAARIAAGRLMGGEKGSSAEAKLLAATLGGLKGPLMKVAQLASTIPDLLPAAYAVELSQLQSQAPPMGWAFVKRRMAAELGPSWQAKFGSFSHEAAHAASLGQVHRAAGLDGGAACRQATISRHGLRPSKRTCRQLQLVFAIHKRMDPVIDTSEIAEEIGARLREELDYEREAKHMLSIRTFWADFPASMCPR